MITQNEKIVLGELSETVDQLLYKFDGYYNEVSEPQLKEDLHKLIASLKNQKRTLEREREGKDNEQ